MPRSSSASRRSNRSRSSCCPPCRLRSGCPPSLHPPAPVVPGETAQTGRVWLSFTASGTGAGRADHGDACAASRPGEIFNVPVTANVVPQRTAAVALVADRSGSMAQDAGNGLTKRQKLGQALGIVAGLARDVDELALVSFDDLYDVVVPIGDALAHGGGRHARPARGGGRRRRRSILAA